MPAQDTHREMVRMIVDDLQRRDLRAIAARLEGEDLPEPDGYFQISTQKWVHPDLQARSGNQLFIYEVETEERLGRRRPGRRSRSWRMPPKRPTGVFLFPRGLILRCKPHFGW